MSKDKHTFSNYDKIQIRHIDLDLKVDFEQQILSGNAILELNNLTNSTELILDIHQLKIQNITANSETLSYQLSEENPTFGQALTIEIQENTKIKIDYQTAPTAEALQWLKPSQTADKTEPFLFTQSQAILARSWIPCQDTPSVRFTYSAKIQTPSHLLPLMSADNPMQKTENGIYQFAMNQAIPSYLMALVVGDLHFESFGKQTGVYAEKSVLESAVYEFSETEKMLQSAEKLYGKYRWERYDLVILPPSFPFGGMENPRLTFATPTIMAGDRSLTSLVAHELAHSWSGNLVTNATWEDFWLNEGFTVYFERRIIEEIYGKSYADMQAVNGFQDLKNTLEHLYNQSLWNDTKLKLDLTGRTPDDAVTDVAYEKGFTLLLLIEQTIGREKWDEFVLNYFSEKSFQSINTEEFVNYIEENLFKKLTTEQVLKINLKKWIYETGLPDNLPVIHSKKFDLVDVELQKLKIGFPISKLQTKNWSAHELLYFLRKLPENITLKKLQELDTHFGFTNSKNAEILGEWFVLVAQKGLESSFSALENFLETVGRRKLVLPIYRALSQNPNSEIQKLAFEIYQKARPNYHFVTTTTLDKLLQK